MACRLSVCSGQCPISGCDSLRSFSSPGVTRLEALSPSSKGSTEPKLLWSYEQSRPSGAGCATDGAGDSGVVICPMEDGQNVSVVSFSASNGSVLWSLSLASQAVLPLISYGGQSVVSDGRTLAWLARDGRSLAPPVTMYPVQGALFDLTITGSTSIVTMLYKCGFIATYTVDGVPISGLWLNGTREGVKGTFVPLGNPVMNDTRLYILTGFREHTTEGGRSNKATTHLRLYAINVAASLDRKFTILWTHSVAVEGKVPYIYMQETYCDILSLRKTKHNHHWALIGSNGRSKISTPPPDMLTMEGGRLLASVHIKNESGTSIAFNMSVKDLGDDYSIVSSGYSENLITSISWSNTNRDSNQNQVHTAFRDRWTNNFWVSFTPPERNVTVLEQLTELTGPPVNASSITFPTALTTPVTLLQYLSSAVTTDLLVFGSSDNVLVQQSSSVRSGSEQPHLVGVMVEREGRGEGKGEGRTEATPVVVWSIPLPHSQPAQGQISTLPLSSHSLFFITTPLGVYAYTVL